jgi:hypothetical protein
MATHHKKITNLLFLVSLCVIFAAATFLRTWDLPQRLIFFGDAAHDFFSAQEALQNKQLPLLGIASSVPRFHQGPVMVWLLMILQMAGLQDPAQIGMVFALLSVAAVMACYELMAVKLTPTAARLTALLIAFSPFAVAQARMPYHTNPIPLMTVVFLWAVQRLWEKKPFSWWWVTLAWALLFQFELAVTPLVLVLPYVALRTNQKPAWKQLGAGLFFGLLPQLVHDLTHRFEHLGGFAVWVGYRLVGFTGVSRAHTFSLSKLTSGLNQFSFYWGRMGGVEFSFTQLIWLGLIIVAMIILWHQFRKKSSQLPSLVEISLISTGALMFGYLIHGSPSEAYFPPFIILIPLLIGYAITTRSPRFSGAVSLVLVVWAVLNVFQIRNANFFVSTPNLFNYGAGLGEQKAILDHFEKEGVQTYQLRTTHPAGKFENYFDNLKWLAQQKNQIIGMKGRTYFIELNPSSLDTYPTIKKIPFTSLSVYEVL